MHIICPHCTTSYAIDLATLGVAGRTVRCSRCKEVWLARPEDAAVIKAPAMADAGLPAANADAEAEWNALAREDHGGAQQTPVVDSPSISADWPSIAGHDMAHARASRHRQAWFRKLLRPRAQPRQPGKPFISLPTVCAAM